MFLASIKSLIYGGQITNIYTLVWPAFFPSNCRSQCSIIINLTHRNKHLRLNVNQNMIHVKCHLQNICHVVPGHTSLRFSITIQIRWKFRLSVISLLIIISQQTIPPRHSRCVMCKIVLRSLFSIWIKAKRNVNRIWIVVENLYSNGLGSKWVKKP